MAALTLITGRGLPLRGDDLDTDRIMPARFLRAVTFEGLEQHLFEDDRSADPKHPFNDTRYHGASILVAGSAVFEAQDPTKVIRELRAAAEA